MTNLGKRFFEPLESLEGEKIVWEGGPSKRGFRAQLLDGFLRWLGVLLAILFLL